MKYRKLIAVALMLAGIALVFVATGSYGPALFMLALLWRGFVVGKRLTRRIREHRRAIPLR